MQIDWKGKNNLEIKTKGVTISTGETIKINDVALSGPGEYEVAGVEAFGIAPDIYLFRVEDINIGYFNSLNRALTPEETKDLSDISIIILPVGGKNTLDEKKAVDIVAALEPTVVIPISADSFDKFCRLIGNCQPPVDSYKIAKQQLSLMEGVTTVILIC